MIGLLVTIICTIIFYPFARAMYKGYKQERVYKSREFVYEIPELIRKDWNDNPQDSKVWSKGKTVGLIAVYRFTNGDEVELHQTLLIKSIVYKRKGGKSYRHDCYSHQYSRIVEMLNKVIGKTNGHKTSNNDSRGNTPPKKKNPKHDHPKWDRYWGLILNIRQRTANLEDIPKGDPNRSGLINELNSAKRQAKRMKDKYKF